MALISLADAHDAGRAVIGGKAAQLAALLADGVRVPAGVVVPIGADAALAAGAARALGDVACAVRSSAIDEDGLSASHAGQYATVLDVRGEAALVDAAR